MAVTKPQMRRLFRDLDKRDEKFARKLMPFLEGLYKYYFRCEVDGWDNIPDGKVLFVGNHNGLLTFEVLMLFYAWFSRHGFDRRALALAHGIALNNPLFRWLTPRIGAIPADPEVGFQAFERDYSLLVFPGGEKEAFRPYSRKAKVDFFGRKGFIRLALRAKVPIVPLVSIGAHETYMILHSGEEIAKGLGLYDRFRLHGVPITPQAVFFFWCVATGIFTFFPLLLAPAALASIFVPLPAKMTFKILPAIDICAMVDPALSDEENHQRIYDQVIGTMQGVLTQEYQKRKFPVIG